jgi:hypothetical protein
VSQAPLAIEQPFPTELSLTEVNFRAQLQGSCQQRRFLRTCSKMIPRNSKDKPRAKPFVEARSEFLKDEIRDSAFPRTKSYWRWKRPFYRAMMMIPRRDQEGMLVHVGSWKIFDCNGGAVAANGIRAERISVDFAPLNPR